MHSPLFALWIAHNRWILQIQQVHVLQPSGDIQCRNLNQEWSQKQIIQQLKSSLNKQYKSVGVRHTGHFDVAITSRVIQLEMINSNELND
jgi:hypothetical protein